MKYIKLLLSAGVLSLLFTSCHGGLVITPTKDIGATTPPQRIATLHPTDFIAFTSMPTMSIQESEQEVERLLESNGGCLLPCIWGLVAGETNYKSAISFFDQLGWRGSEVHGYYETGKDLNNNSLVININFYVQDDIIQKISFALGAKDFLSEVKGLSFTNVINVLGKPSDILVNIGTNPGVMEPEETSFDILLYYQGENSLFEYTGTTVRYGEIYRVCPSEPNKASSAVDPRSGNVSVYVGGPDQVLSPQELVRPFWILPEYYIPVEKAFGLDVNNFYDMASLKGGDICFSSMLSAWQR